MNTIKAIFAMIGAAVVAIVLVSCGAAMYAFVGFSSDVNQAPTFINNTVSTFEALEAPPSNGVVIEYATATAVIPDTLPVTIEATAAVETAVPLPTSTPASTLPPLPSPTPEQHDHGLPDHGPYTKSQYDQCVAIDFNGQMDTLSEPQRSLCQQYLDANNE